MFRYVAVRFLLELMDCQAAAEFGLEPGGLRRHLFSGRIGGSYLSFTGLAYEWKN